MNTVKPKSLQRQRKSASRNDPVIAQLERTERAGISHSELISEQWQRERGGLDLGNFLLAIYLMRLGTLVDRAYDRYCLREFGISGGDMRVMLALRRSGTPYMKRPTDLYKALLVTSGAVTKKVDRLVELGFVARLVDPNHGGGFLVKLTKRGLHVVDAATDHLANHSVLAPAMAMFSQAQQASGSEFVLRLLSNLESQTGVSADELDS